MHRLLVRVVAGGFVSIALAPHALAQSWAPTPIPTSETIRAVHFVSEDLGWAAGYAGVVLRTEDGGASWLPQVSETTSQRLLAIRFVDASNGWLAAGRHVAYTTDGGADWIPVTIDGNPNVFRNSIFASSATQAWAPAVCGSCVQRWFYRYTVGPGGSTAEQTYDLTSSSAQFIDLHFIDADNGWAVGTNGLVRRITAASSDTPGFAPQTSGVVLQLNAIHMLDANLGWIVGNTGTILATTNGGAQWTPQTSGTSANLRDVSFRDAQNGWAVGDVGTILVTADGGANWDPEDSTVDTTLWSVSAQASVYAGGGDAANSANAAVLKRAAPPDLILRDGFEDA